MTDLKIIAVCELMAAVNSNIFQCLANVPIALVDVLRKVVSEVIPYSIPRHWDICVVELETFHVPSGQTRSLSSTVSCDNNSLFSKIFLTLLTR
jgi:hypothetical protein